MSEPRWICRGALYHAFVLSDAPKFPSTSACGAEQINDGRTFAIGAAKCIECAVALGQEPPKAERGRWSHNRAVGPNEGESS